jgi:SAM-dependent methyltransferase
MKLILDACCGGRMFWYDKKNPDVLFMDKRVRPPGFLKERPNFEVSPDVEADFRDMPFDDASFQMVVFDPPHILGDGETSHMAKRYGKLPKETWEDDLRQGFSECWRVLKTGGTLVFKWGECSKKLRDVEHLFPAQPLFGHRSGARGGTIWVCFMKL